MEYRCHQTVNRRQNWIFAVSLIGNALNDIHLIHKNLILAAETAEFTEVSRAENLAFAIVKQILIHNLENIHAGIPHKIHVRLNCGVAVMHALRKMEPETGRNTIDRFSFQYAINSFFSVHK